jgi:hypothetical protein
MHQVRILGSYSKPLYLLILPSHVKQYMKKAELINLNMLMVQVKNYFEEQGLYCEFVKYKDLEISPFQVHRSKDEHKQAIFVLGRELASMTTQGTFMRAY